MKIEECENCEFHVEKLSDSVLCQFEGDLEHHILSEKKIVGCPKQPEKKGLKKFFS